MNPAVSNIATRGTLTDQTVVHAPKHRIERRGSWVYAFAPAVPAWIATDERGAEILSLVDGRRGFGRIVDRYCSEQKIDRTRGWLYCHTFLNNALSRRFLSTEPFAEPAYLGRAAHLEPSSLRELWIHTNNSCNLSCTHCLVSSGPSGEPGPNTATLKKWIDDGVALGVERMYFTGGEPMVRKDFWDLAEYVTARASLAVITNATLIEGARLERLKRCDPELLTLQVSLDGSTPDINDPLRGRGSFERTVAGIRNAVAAGFMPTLTTVVTRHNVDDLPALVRLANELGMRAVHFMWMHMKGRAVDSGQWTVDRQNQGQNQFVVEARQIIEALRRAKAVADEVGVGIDNLEAFKTRLGAPAGLKFDLSNACWESLCVYSDGSVYPSAATAQVSELRLGSLHESTLRDLWKNSPVARRMRGASVEHTPQCSECRFKFMCGGGDVEHRYFWGQDSGQKTENRKQESGNRNQETGNRKQTGERGGNGGFAGDDPYCEVYQHLFESAMDELAARGDQRDGRKTGFDAPVVFAGSGDVRTHDFGLTNGGVRANQIHVAVKHSNCVLAFDLDTYRKPVREFYGAAAKESQPDLCCPVQYNAEYLEHIPKEVIERFYGCGGPMQEADVRVGATVLDLGSGAGIDCFIASKRVGAGGRVIGIDMTDEMLARAEANREIVAGNLGYANVEFRRGFLEAIPAEDASVDLVTSNCVINLSPDKRKVFREIWRVLRDTGTFHVSDIVTEEELPLSIAVQERLVGECIGRALTERQFLAALEQAGFYGITLTKKFFWKEIEGHKIYSVSVRGQKLEKSKGCVFIGQKAIYHGPFKATVDEEGHLFPRGEEVEICTDTALKLSNPPYSASFTVIAPDGNVENACCPSPDSGQSCC